MSGGVELARSSRLAERESEGATQTTSRIGPNAIIQTGIALRAFGGTQLEHDIFARAGLAHYIAGPPHEMLDEREAQALFNVLFAKPGLSFRDADAVLRDAGARTGDYILAHRIPKLAQAALKILPRPLAARALLAAIAKHSWTFAGSGRVTCSYGGSLVIEIANNPLAFGTCVWHCAVFERLFATLVSKRARAVYVSRINPAGETACRFEIKV